MTSTKTPEEMAEEYCASPHEKDAFLVGYHTAYNIAYECGFEEGLKTQRTLTDIQAKLKKTNENT